MARWQLAWPRLLPPPGIARTIALQSALAAIGGGMFLTGGIVFFTTVLRLTPVQIGIGYSVAGVATMAGALPLGALSDRVGGQRSWAVGALAGGTVVAAYPAVRSFALFLVLLVLTGAADAFANAGRTIYTSDAVPAGERVTTMAYARTYLNIGFTLGTGFGALALAFDSATALTVMVYLNAFIMLVNAGIVTLMPAAALVRHEKAQRSRLAVLRDRPYVALALLVGLLMYHAVILTEIIPLWVVTATDAPKPVLGAVFALNTVMVITLQVRAARGATSLPGTVRLLRAGAVTTAIACPVAALAGLTHGLWTVAALLLVIVLATATELWLSAALWYYQTDVPPAPSRGAYIGAARTVSEFANVFAPAGLTLLVIGTGGWGWWIVALLFLGCAVAARPVVAWVERTPRIDGVTHAQRLAAETLTRDRIP